MTHELVNVLYFKLFWLTFLKKKNMPHINSGWNGQTAEGGILEIKGTERGKLGYI